MVHLFSQWQSLFYHYNDDGTFFRLLFRKLFPLGGCVYLARGGGGGGGGGERVALTHFFSTLLKEFLPPAPSHFLYSAPFVVAWIWQCFDVLNSSC